MEDVGKFRSARQQEADARKPPPGMVPGMSVRPEIKAALGGMSASQKKNQKRKEKRKEDDGTKAKEPVSRVAHGIEYTFL